MFGFLRRRKPSRINLEWMYQRQGIWTARLAVRSMFLEVLLGDRRFFLNPKKNLQRLHEAGRAHFLEQVRKNRGKRLEKEKFQNMLLAVRLVRRENNEVFAKAEANFLRVPVDGSRGVALDMVCAHQRMAAKEYQLSREMRDRGFLEASSELQQRAAREWRRAQSWVRIAEEQA